MLPRGSREGGAQPDTRRLREPQALSPSRCWPGHVPRGPGHIPSMPQMQPGWAGGRIPQLPSPVSPLLSVSVKGRSSSPLQPVMVTRLQFRLAGWGLVTERHGLPSSRRSEARWAPPEWAVRVS